MDKALFRKKYLGEVTLKNGDHVTFCFPLTESDVAKFQIESENIWRRISNNPQSVQEYKWAVYDDMDLSQFRIAYAAIKKYGKGYWKLLWEEYVKKNQKK